MAKLRLTHLIRDEWGDGYYIRFTAGWDAEGKAAWQAFKNKLACNRRSARWCPKMKFDDGTIGAWWVDAFTLFYYKYEFSNYDEAMRRCNDPLKAFRDSLRQIIPAPIKQALQTLNFPPDKLPSSDQIKKQYRALAFACHPDRTKGHDDRIKAVNNANDVLQG